MELWMDSVVGDGVVGDGMVGDGVAGDGVVGGWDGGWMGMDRTLGLSLPSHRCKSIWRNDF